MAFVASLPVLRSRATARFGVSNAPAVRYVRSDRRVQISCTAAPVVKDPASGAVSKDGSGVSSSARGVVPRELLSAVGRLAAPLYAKSRRGRAVGWTLLVVALAFASTMYAVAMSMVLRTFWNTLSAKDVAKFGKLMKGYAAAVVVGPIVLTTFEWAKGRLALLWRTALTERYLARYFAPGSVPYYRVSSSAADSAGESTIDNSDQRLTEDVRAFSERAVRFLCVFGVAIFDLGIFSVMLFRIYPPLFFALIAYSVLGTVGVSVFGKSLVGMNAAQLQREADYRFSLLRVRDNAESIAFYRGEASEKSEAMRRFQALFGNALRLLGKTRAVSLVTTSHKYWVQIFPTLILGPAYFAGKIVLGTISQTMFAFNHVLSSMGLIVTEFVALSEFGAGVRRLDRLSGAMDRLEDLEASGEGIKNEVANLGDPPCLFISELSLETPTAPHRPLVQGLNLVVDPGQRLLLTGVSGVGKTSLLRAIAGLWKRGKGSITRPADGDAMFLPQRPFLSLGTLRENVVYPLEGEAAEAVSDQDVLNALDRANLPTVAERMGGLDAPGEDVGKRLSLGEQQRLAFARLVLSRPKFVLLDESTSALDADNEKFMYAILDELNITCVTVGNQATLPQYHTLGLKLEQGGEWLISRLHHM